MSIDISDTTRRIQYSGSAGTGPYQFAFEILAQTDVAVYVDETLQTLTTNYTVTINGDGTGSITLLVAATGSNTITIIGDRAIARSTDFVTGGDLLADSLNDELDSLTIYCQQLEEKFARCFAAPEYDTASTLSMPDVATRASKYLAFDAQGNPAATSGTTNAFIVSTFAETLLDDTTAAAARATLGLTIGTNVQAYDADIPTVAASQGEMETGTEAALRAMSPLRVAQAISVLAGGTRSRQVFTSGTAATYTTPAGCTAISIRMIGGGGGGGAQNTNAGAAGIASTWSGGSLSAGGGGGGATASGAPGAGGASSNGDINIPGGAGCGGPGTGGASNDNSPGGAGGNGAFGGGGATIAATAGGNAATNSGGGGGGGGISGPGALGQGGGAGGYVEKLISSPAATYTYTVGTGGAGGAAGTLAGGNGAAGIIIVDEFY